VPIVVKDRSSSAPRVANGLPRPLSAWTPAPARSVEVLHRRATTAPGRCTQYLGNDSWKTRGGGWMAAPTTRDQPGLVGHGQPGSVYDWSSRLDDRGARPEPTCTRPRWWPGSRTVSSRPTTRAAHDGWDSTARGRVRMLERGGKNTLHPNKSGFVFVYDRMGRCTRLALVKNTTS